MLRYYSYYSVGGYKDLFLGSNQSDVEATYYLPLLPILEERAHDDEDASKIFDSLKGLPKIQQLSADEPFNLPLSARTMFSHAGYKVIYRHLEGDCYALAIRDVPDKNKDEQGRSIPFMFLITGDNIEDIISLNILATYFASHIKSVETFLSQSLHMDIETNGLKFEIAKVNDWIKTIIRISPSSLLPTMKGGIPIKAEQGCVALLVTQEGISVQKAITEQKLENMNISSVQEIEILSKEEPERLVRQMLELTDELKEERKKNALIKKGAIAAGVGGFLIGALISSCCR